jgi:hypothetical protein
VDRFHELLAHYRDGRLDAAGRAELGWWIEVDPACLEAFIDLVSDLRIRRLSLQRN